MWFFSTIFLLSCLIIVSLINHKQRKRIKNLRSFYVSELESNVDYKQWMYIANATKVVFDGVGWSEGVLYLIQRGALKCAIEVEEGKEQEMLSYFESFGIETQRYGEGI